MVSECVSRCFVAHLGQPRELGRQPEPASARVIASTKGASRWKRSRKKLGGVVKSCLLARVAELIVGMWPSARGNLVCCALGARELILEVRI